jgi:hypothetical protein
LIEFDHKTSAAFQRDSHNQTAGFLRDLHRSIASAGFHGCHKSASFFIQSILGQSFGKEAKLSRI